MEYPVSKSAITKTPSQVLNIIARFWYYGFVIQDRYVDLSGNIDFLNNIATPITELKPSRSEERDLEERSVGKYNIFKITEKALLTSLIHVDLLTRKIYVLFVSLLLQLNTALLEVEIFKSDKYEGNASEFIRITKTSLMNYVDMVFFEREKLSDLITILYDQSNTIDLLRLNVSNVVRMIKYHRYLPNIDKVSYNDRRKLIEILKNAFMYYPIDAMYIYHDFTMEKDRDNIHFKFLNIPTATVNISNETVDNEKGLSFLITIISDIDKFERDIQYSLLKKQISMM